MQKITTHMVALFLATLFFTSCQDNNFNNLTPGPDCATQKEWTNYQGKRVLLNEYAFKGDEFAKLTHYDFDGKKTESLPEYDSQGRLLKIFEKVTGENNTPVAQYETTFTYYNDGKLYQTDNYKVEDGNHNLIQTRLYYYDNEKVSKIVSSFGVHWRYEYNENDNVTKTYFQPAGANEYLEEEYTSYDDKLLTNTLKNLQISQNVSRSSAGLNFSKNNATAYKVYNPDGSVKTTYTVSRNYNASGKQTKVVTTASTNSTPVTTVVETEYPTCR
ncbi:MAG: hypothetical protein ACO1OF_07505 [Adhaeribacter sp.]